MTSDVVCDVSSFAPSLSHYRREWTPKGDVGLSGLWVGAVVSDASGRQYWGLRGADDFVRGMTHVVSPICGFRLLARDFNTPADHLFSEYSTIDWFEPLTYLASAEQVQTFYPSGRIERDDEGFHWFDASGRWEIHGNTVSAVVLTHVPTQDELADNDVYYRHELMHVTGSIDGVDVSGYAHQDFAYGPDGLIYTELPIARNLQGMWMSWLHEYDDGTVGGGSFWQGRSGLDFGPGYQLRDGRTTVHNDVRAQPSFDANGRLISLDATLGDESYRFAFNNMGSPLHYFGELTSDTSGRSVARSWCWVEHAGDLLTPDLLDLASAQFRLARGR
ncbi:hypothetical protein [Mycolicibacterium fluoranthenivorans]|uniref:hypothetical protein n=1 Tax=Mycolicibacterium fluoranthenivorans TaxID=258505 RepID=UPI00141F8342|nr:hypothetical protein [Mycolicibacterium fluoranthenivorans]MCV7354181.1 hypothetical protein [Mycolicibacterium fluoranthenivorans]